VDLLFVAEGYTAEDKDKFTADVDRLTGWMFEIEPYRGAKGKFNVTGIMRPSPEPPWTSPGRTPSRRPFLTLLSTPSISTLHADRGRHRLREVAARSLRCDRGHSEQQKVRRRRIYNDYCATTVDNGRSKAVFIHEFGHSFAGLGDDTTPPTFLTTSSTPRALSPRAQYHGPPRSASCEMAHLLVPGIQVLRSMGRRGSRPRVRGPENPAGGGPESRVGQS